MLFLLAFNRLSEFEASPASALNMDLVVVASPSLIPYFNHIDDVSVLQSNRQLLVGVDLIFPGLSCEHMLEKVLIFHNDLIFAQQCVVRIVSRCHISFTAHFQEILVQAFEFLVLILYFNLLCFVFQNFDLFSSPDFVISLVFHGVAMEVAVG